MLTVTIGTQMQLYQPHLILHLQGQASGFHIGVGDI